MEEAEEDVGEVRFGLRGEGDHFVCLRSEEDVLGVCEVVFVLWYEKTRWLEVVVDVRIYELREGVARFMKSSRYVEALLRRSRGIMD